MSKLERISQACLYMGALLAVLFADWHWYAGHYPAGNALLRAEFYPIIYTVFFAAAIGCFAAAICLKQKARPRQTGHEKRKR